MIEILMSSIVVQLAIASACIGTGIMVGLDANKRGMNPIGWGIFAALVIFIGLPIYLIAREPIVEKVEPFSDADILDTYKD